MHEIIVDEEGYKQFFSELEKLNNLSIKNASDSSEAYDNAVGDGWHDNFAFEDTMRESRIIAKKIDKMLEDRNKLKVIHDNNYNKKIVNLGDTILILIKYSENDEEEEYVKLTGKYLPDINNDIQEVTLNSPIGNAIYQKKVNEKVNCVINGKNVEIKIMSKKV